jgi:hypothetical protein
MRRNQFCGRFALGHLLLVMCAGDTAAECEVRSVGGVPTLVIDGQPSTGFCYSTYDTSSPNLEQRAAQFAGAGCRIFNFVVEISGYGYSRPLWPGPDRWDFTDLDDRARRVLAAAPDSWLLPRIYIDAPQWWREQHPDEMMVLDNGETTFAAQHFALPRAGPFPSLASRKWRAEMQAALGKILTHIEQSGYGHRVIGYQLSGQKTEEWYHWSMNCPRLGDYSWHMQREFRRWLQEKYGSDEQLQQAWQRPDLTIAAAEIPSRDERVGDRSHTFRRIPEEQHVVDFHTFWSDIMADAIELFARTVKQQCDGSKVVGAFYAYTFEFADLAEDAGHLALHRLLRSPHIDFIMAPSSYFNRNLPGAPFFRAPTTSFTLHGKLFWNDFDQVSFKYFDKVKADPNLKNWQYQMGLTHTAEEFIWMNCREIGMSLTSGVQTAHFDIHGGYYDDPQIMQGVRQLERVRRTMLEVPNRSPRAEILLVVDEHSPHYLRFRSPADLPDTLLRSLLKAQLAEMGFVAPYETALLSDLDQLELRRYKLILMLNAFRLDRSQRVTIRQRLCGGGRTVVWLYAPGYLNEHGAHPNNIHQLTGMRVVPTTRPTTADFAVWTGNEQESASRVPLLDGDAFLVDDPEAEVIAKSGGDPKQILVARRDLDDWTSVYSATAPLPARFLKQLAEQAGVHIYTRNADLLLYANQHLLMIGGSNQAQQAEIRLPQRADVVDAITGQLLAEQSDRIDIPLRAKEVRLLRLER